jgi:HEAT repeats
LRLAGKHRWWAVAGAVAAVIAIWALWSRPFSAVSESTGAEDESATSAPAVREAAGARAPVGRRRWEKDEVPMPGCWPALRDFDRAATLEDLHAAIAAVGGQDVLLAEYLQQKLTELIGSDPVRAQTVLGWAKQAAGPELEILLGALKAAPAVREPSVAQALLAVGEDQTAAVDLRSRALDALETQQRLDDGMMGRMKAIAMDESSDAAAWMATRTLGRVMKEDFDRTGSYERYWKELLSIGRESEETAVQLLALEMPSYADPVLEEGSIEALAELLRSDPDRNVREMAAHRLSVTRASDRVLEIFRAAFPQERDECVRWAIFRFTARVAGPRALPLLAELAAIDPRFKPDHDEFAALYASGAVDFARIWLGVTERHQCLTEEGDQP